MHFDFSFCLGMPAVWDHAIITEIHNIHTYNIFSRQYNDIKYICTAMWFNTHAPLPASSDTLFRSQRFVLSASTLWQDTCINWCPTCRLQGYFSLDIPWSIYCDSVLTQSVNRCDFMKVLLKLRRPVSVKYNKKRNNKLFTLMSQS